MKMLKDVKDFLEKFNVPQREPGQPFNRDVVLFRLSCLLEELQELSQSMNNDDFAETTDALVDLVYFAIGTAHVFNLPFEKAWGEVHGANMRKIRLATSRQSKRGSVLDVGKPKGWIGPNIEQFLSPDDRKVVALDEQLDLEAFIKGQGPVK